MKTFDDYLKSNRLKQRKKRPVCTQAPMSGIVEYEVSDISEKINDKAHRLDYFSQHAG